MAERARALARPHPTQSRLRSLTCWLALGGVVVVGVLLISALTGAPVAAAPTSSTSPSSTSSPGSAAANPPAANPPAADPTTTDPDQRFADIAITSLTPTMVTSSSGSTVTVTGSVRNTSSRTLRDLSIRIERGDAAATANALRAELAVDHPPISAASAFRGLADTLTPGNTARFTIAVPLSTATGLRISEPGVYPIQINVNGVPDYGSMAQVAGSRTLLPVLSLPPDAARATNYVDPADGLESTTTPGLGADGSVSANTSAPARLTMLWPIAAPPQLAPGVLGGNTESVRLISEDLSRSLADGGRLKTLLDPLRTVIESSDRDGSNPEGSDPSNATPSGPSSASATPSGTPTSGSSPDTPTSSDTPTPAAGPATSELARSMCLAVDPDLLVTVRAMSLGYVVSADPADPTSSTTPGTGAAAASAWLDQLSSVASRMCVVALPFAGVDLTALARVNNSGLTATALDSPPDVVDAVLGVKSVRGLTIPALGAVDAAGAAVMRTAKQGRLVTSSANIAPTGNSNADGAYRINDLAVQSFDEPVTAALAGLGTKPSTPAITPTDQLVDLAGESPVSRRQAALGALAFTAVTVPSAPTTGANQTGDNPANLPTTGRSQLVLPSRYWSPTTDDADALLSTASVLLGSRTAVATPLSDVVTTMSDSRTAARLATAPDGVGSIATVSVPLPATTAATIRDQADLTWQLQGSLVSSTDVESSPERYMAPLREDLLRALHSPAQYGAPTRQALSRDRASTVTAVGGTLDRMRAAVTILDPGGRYTLASERSPLLLVVRNDLSLPVRVRITTTAPADLDVGDIGAVEIPARGTRQIQLPTRANSSEALNVTISMDTVTGVSLGERITLSVHSNAYGRALFIITIVAAVALVLLTARRLWHRFRGEPDPADVDRPEPDELERLLAATTYQQRRRTLHSDEPAGGDEPAAGGDNPDGSGHNPGGSGDDPNGSDPAPEPDPTTPDPTTPDPTTPDPTTPESPTGGRSTTPDTTRDE